MDSFVDNTGVTEREKQVQVPIENAETANAPFNEEDTTVLKNPYAFGKGLIKR